MKTLHLMSFICLGLVQSRSAAEKPNFVVIFTDDQDYGDLSCFGGIHVSTPRIDQMAAEGSRAYELLCGGSGLHSIMSRSHDGGAAQNASTWRPGQKGSSTCTSAKQNRVFAVTLPQFMTQCCEFRVDL